MERGGRKLPIVLVKELCMWVRFHIWLNQTNLGFSIIGELYVLKIGIRFLIWYGMASIRPPAN
jgi:hypothetical protein